MKKTKRSVLSIILALIMVVGNLSVQAQECTEDITPVLLWSGSGTESDPYLIETSEDLEKLSMLCASGDAVSDKHFKMTADVTLPEDWTAIGALKTDSEETGNGANINPFSGTFDGDNHIITVAENGKPLFGYVREADILNLNISGTKIDGYGLVDNYVVDYGADGSSYTEDDPKYTAIIDNCTLKSGSSTLNSGFIGGYASGVNTVTIKNSTIEDGVTIGYTKEKSNIGGFAGEFNGMIINCRNSGDIYGADFVGGIVANKGQALGKFEVYDCIVDGDVTATGKYVGGITGGGFGGTLWGFSANAQWPVIKNCIASGSVTGADAVGGIMGAEPGTLQCWETGIGYIQNNLFTGTVSATDENASVGGIIGFIKAANRYTIISNNYYSESCGTDKGIGEIEITEKSSSNENIGEGWYAATLNGAKYGRDDEPMGEGALSLSKPYTEAEYSDGTLLDALNNGIGTSGDWIQNESGIAFGGVRHLISVTSPEISISNGLTQKVDETDILKDKTLTLLYSDGTTENISTDTAEKQYKLTNDMDGKSIAASILYNKQQLAFMLNVVKGEDKKEDNGGGSSSNKITVKFKLLGDERHGEGEIHTLKQNNLDTWIKQTSVTADKGATVLDVFAKVLEDNGYSWVNNNEENGKTGGYIQSITTPDGDTLAEFDNGSKSGWLYTLNGKQTETSIDEQTLKSGDTIVFHYTDDYSAETITQKWTSSGGGATSSLTVTFETNGGSEINKVTVNRNTTISEPQEPVKDGFVFEGWYTNEELTQKYDFASRVTKSFKLYAKWTEVQTAPATDLFNIDSNITFTELVIVLYRIAIVTRMF